MALPAISVQYTLDTICLGSPFIQVATKSTIDLNTLNVVYLGVIFWGLSPAAAPGGVVYNAVFFGTNV